MVNSLHLYFCVLLPIACCCIKGTTGFLLRRKNQVFPCRKRTGGFKKLSFTVPKMEDSKQASVGDSPSSTTINEDNDNDAILFRVIQINDVYKLDNFPHFKSLVDHYKTEKNAKGLMPSKTIVVLAGDFLGPSLLSSLDRGRGIVDIMTACGISHVCFGNHETDIPMEALPHRIEESGFVWVNTNMRDLDNRLGVITKPYDVVTISKESCKSNEKSQKKVAILGLLTEDPTLYREGAFGNATIEPVTECTKRTLEELARDQNIDYVLPLTHQSMPRDRKFAKTFGGSFPLVIGGHDHDIYDEVHNSCRIVKTGMDAVNTAIIDIEWGLNTDKSSNEPPTTGPSVRVDMISTKAFPADPTIEQRCNFHMRIVRELDVAKLFRINSKSNDDKFTTVSNRKRPTKGSIVLATAIRRGMRAECAIVNAGSIRGGKTYDTEWFTWSDLKSEIPFPTEMTTVKMPGIILSDTIAYSRKGAYLDPPIESGGYMQVCDMIRYNNDKKCIESIRGEPFDPKRIYLVALPIGALNGMDNNEPLITWVSECDSMVHQEAGIPGKMAIVEFFAASLWLELGSFADIDSDQNGIITPEELKNHAENVFGRELADLAIANVMAVADLDDDGCIKPLEMLLTRYIATDMVQHVSTQDEIEVVTRLASELLDLSPNHSEVKEAVQKVFKKVDTKKNGRMTRDEAISVLGDVHSSDLLS